MTAQIIQFNSTLIRVLAHRYNGSIIQRKRYPIVDKKFKGTRKKIWFLKNDVYYDIKIGDYICEEEKSGELFLLAKIKHKKLRKNGERSFLISRLELV